MNLHVTNDSYGFYPLEIAKRIKESGLKETNRIVNLSSDSILKDDIITYIRVSKASFNNLLKLLDHLDKIIFHPYTYNSYLFLNIALQRFKSVKVYWVSWSHELYSLPPVHPEYYKPFSKKYFKTKQNFRSRLTELRPVQCILKFMYFAGIKTNQVKQLKKSYKRIDFFCSLLPSDFLYFKKISLNQNTIHLPFAYLSLREILPELNNYKVRGNKIMIGHSSSPSGNHFETLQTLRGIGKDFSIFLPLAYGDKKYGDLIEKEARNFFSNVDVQRNKLNKADYYKKLKEISCAIINVKVQQGLANILILIFMGVKVFLDDESGTFRDLRKWGITVFSIQLELNKTQLATRLEEIQIENNRRLLYEKVNEEKVKQYWDEILLS